MIKKCLSCGKEFEDRTQNKTKKYCGAVCVRIAARQREREARERARARAGRMASPKKETLKDVVRKANAAGMTYGKYVAKYKGR